MFEINLTNVNDLPFINNPINDVTVNINEETYFSYNYAPIHDIDMDI
jgi:hypothetical protein